jgi:hypothetical protein
MTDFEVYVKEKFSKWKANRVLTKLKLKEWADRLDSLHIGSLFKRASGYAISIAGGTTVIVGLILAHSTFGLSISLTVGGIIVWIGNLITIWSSVEKDIKTRSICKSAEKLINNEFNHKMNSCEISFISSADFRRQMENGLGALFGKTAQEGINVANIVSNIQRAKSVGHVSDASRILVHGNSTLQCVGLSLSGLFLVLEFVRLIETWIEIKDSPTSDFSSSLRNVACELERNIDEMEQFLDELEEGNLDLLF